jgi:hypothetical protein
LCFLALYAEGKEQAIREEVGKDERKNEVLERHLNLEDQAEILDLQGDKADIHPSSGACNKPCDNEVVRKAVVRGPKCSAP